MSSIFTIMFDVIYFFDFYLISILFIYSVLYLYYFLNDEV